MKILQIFITEDIKQCVEDRIKIIINSELGVNSTYTDVHLYMTTEGGDVDPAFRIYDLFKSLSQKTSVFNIGKVWSAGIIVFLAFQTRFALTNSTFLIHPTTMSVESLFKSAGYNASIATLTWGLNAQELKPNVDLLYENDRKIQELYSKETGTDINIFIEVMNQNKFRPTETKIDTSKAKELILIHEVCDFLNVNFIPNEQSLV